MTKDGLWGEIKLCVIRTFTSDFQKGKATDAERAKLKAAARPVESPLAQDYAAWRRATLWVSAIALVLLSILELISHKSLEDQILEQGREAGTFEQSRQVIATLGPENLEVFDGIILVVMLSTIAGAILTMFAARKWADLKASRKLARAAWVTMLATPLLLALIPATSMMDFHRVDEHARGAAQMFVGAITGLQFMMFIAPKFFSLFPGIIRSSMTLKTLLPESAAPGWATAIVAPLYVMFLFLLVAIVNQIGGNILLLGGILCLMCSPLVYLRRGRDILRPHTVEEATTLIAKARSKATLFNLAGFGLVAVYIITKEALGVVDFLRLVLSIEGHIWLLNVAASDLTLALLRQNHEGAKAFAGSALQKSLEGKFDALTGVGLTDFRTT